MHERPWTRLPSWAIVVAWVGTPSAALFYVLWRLDSSLQDLTAALQALAGQQATLAELVRLALR